jgi:prepilin-type N-terminal cleavage/methylation domain-containing protein
MLRKPSSKSRRRKRGVTLFEVLIVVAILAMISAATAYALSGVVPKTKIKNAHADARTVRNAVKMWWLEHDGCPTVQQLVADEALDHDTTGKDPWGSPWALECKSHDVVVTSLGPDRQPGTPDDIRIPPT